MKIQILLGAWLLGLSTVAQTPWILQGNNSTSPGSDYLGTDDQKRLTIRTDDEWRMQVNESETYNIGSFSLMPAEGFVGISPNSTFWGNAPKGPFTRLHLAEGKGDNSQDIGYRPWMRNGVSLTGNADQGYMGQKYTYEHPQDYGSGELKDYTDLVLQWSDNPGKELKDRMRFIFTSGYEHSNTTGANSLEGLEGMRLYPVNKGEMNVGIGDFFAANITSSSAEVISNEQPLVYPV